MVGASRYRRDKGQGEGIGGSRRGSGQVHGGTVMVEKRNTPGMVQRQRILHRRKIN